MIESYNDEGSYGNIEIYSDSVYFTTNDSVYGTFVNDSDERLKNIVADNINLSIENIANSPIVKFTWNENSKNPNKETVHVGTIAQYWNTILPEIVSQNKDGMYAMQYDVAALVSSISAAKEIVALKQEIAELKAQLNK